MHIGLIGGIGEGDPAKTGHIVAANAQMFETFSGLINRA